jgi:hypothetical protein
MHERSEYERAEEPRRPLLATLVHEAGASRYFFL